MSHEFTTAGDDRTACLKRKRRLAGEQVQGPPGMTLLHNELVVDDELAATVSMALARDARAASQHNGVYPRLGEVHLHGSVQSGASCERAGEVAAALASVTHVVNELRVDPGAGAAGDQLAIGPDRRVFDSGSSHAAACRDNAMLSCSILLLQPLGGSNSHDKETAMALSTGMRDRGRELAQRRRDSELARQAYLADLHPACPHEGLPATYIGTIGAADAGTPIRLAFTCPSGDTFAYDSQTGDVSQVALEDKRFIRPEALDRLNRGGADQPRAGAWSLLGPLPL